jgi:hypothetical protein
MAQCGLRDIELIRSFRQPSTFMNGFHRTQMAELDMHISLMLILRIMNLSHNYICGTTGATDPER